MHTSTKKFEILIVYFVNSYLAVLSSCQLENINGTFLNKFFTGEKILCFSNIYCIGEAGPGLWGCGLRPGRPGPLVFNVGQTGPTTICTCHGLKF